MPSEYVRAATQSCCPSGDALLASGSGSVQYAIFTTLGTPGATTRAARVTAGFPAMGQPNPLRHGGVEKAAQRGPGNPLGQPAWNFYATIICTVCAVSEIVHRASEPLSSPAAVHQGPSTREFLPRMAGQVGPGIDSLKARIAVCFRELIARGAPAGRPPICGILTENCS